MTIKIQLMYNKKTHGRHPEDDSDERSPWIQKILRYTLDDVLFLT